MQLRGGCQNFFSSLPVFLIELSEITHQIKLVPQMYVVPDFTGSTCIIQVELLQNECPCIRLGIDLLHMQSLVFDFATEHISIGPFQTVNRGKVSEGVERMGKDEL